MGESDEHRDEMIYILEVLQDHFARHLRVYVSGNNFVYYTKGVPADCVSPDAYVVKGVPMRQRDTYKVWEEGGHRPCFVLEVTSKCTRREDLGDKLVRYQDELQVPDYFLFDPRRDWIRERLRGYRLRHGRYEPIVADAAGRLPSRSLDLELAAVERHLRFYLPGAPDPLPTRAERERKRADRAEAELARLRAGMRRRKPRRS